MWELQYYQAAETRVQKIKELLRAPVVKFWVDTVSVVVVEFMTFHIFIIDQNPTKSTMLLLLKSPWPHLF